MDHPQQILFVDDDPKICSGVRRLFQQHQVPWRYQFAGGTAAALAFLLDQPVDAVISDIRMPGQDGFALLSSLRGNPFWQDLPIVMLTGLDNPGLKSKALDLGATDLLNKPVNPEELLARIRSVLQIKRYQDIIKQQNTHLEELVRQRTQSLAATRLDMIWRLARAAEFRSNETGNHVIRVGYYARLLAEQYGLGQEEAEMVFLTSPLHDIGKIGIPDTILLKKGKLSASEWQIMQQHCQMGRELLAELPAASDSGLLYTSFPGRQTNECERNPFLDMAADIAGCHHEQFAGGGYPLGLTGEQIPLAARLVAIADVYDALRSQRSYKAGYSHQETLALMQEENGSRFDPRLFAVFLACAEQFRAIHQRYSDR